MPISEKELYIPTLKLLYEYEKLSTTRLRKLLYDQFEDIMDEDDLKSYKSRTDTAFDQTVRNMKSHYEGNYLGQNGYIVFNDEGEWVITEKGKKLVEATDSFSDSLDKKKIHKLEEEKEKFREQTVEYTTRGKTGAEAEDLFLTFFKNDKFEFIDSEQELIDKRYDGDGYDFRVGEFKIEVKGLLGDTGGIIFTKKEWEQANKFGEDYKVVLFKDIGNDPEFIIISNPAKKLNAKKNEEEITRITWSVSSTEINNI